MCAVGESIENGEIFINKVSPTNTKDMMPMSAGNSLPDHMYKSTPMSYKGAKGETSVVDKVLLTQNDEQEDIFKVFFMPYAISGKITAFQQLLRQQLVRYETL